MLPVIREEINHSDTIHMSLREIMLIICAIISLLLEKGPLVNSLSFGIHLAWLSRSCLIPPWVISPMSVIAWDMWGIWCQGMATIKNLMRFWKQ